MKKITLLTIGLCCTLNAIAQIPSAMGLVLDYPFSGNAKDKSVSKNDGQVSGAVLTTDRFGNENSAYYFNGSSYITFPSKNIEFNYYSLSAWVKVESLPSVAASMGVILGLGNSGADQNLFLSNDLGFGMTSYVEGKSVPLGVIVAPLPDVDTWYNLTVTRGLTYIKFYINGELRGTTISQNSTSVYAPNSIGTIGARHGGALQYFNGTIDDVKIYSRALTQAEVVLLHRLDVITGNTVSETAMGLYISQSNSDKNVFQIGSESNFSGDLRVTNLQGQTILESKIVNLKGSQSFEVSSGCRGMRVITVTNELGQSIRKKFVIE